MAPQDVPWQLCSDGQVAKSVALCVNERNGLSPQRLEMKSHLDCAFILIKLLLSHPLECDHPIFSAFRLT